MNRPNPKDPPTIRAFERGAVAYPRQLEALSVPPKCLWVLGTWPLAQTPVVAIVGARAASGAGMSWASDLAAELTTRGALVVSGGAVGIDAAAHRGAVRTGGATVSVVAPGLDAPYPQRHEGLYADILAAGGALLSIVPPGSELQKWHFPARNQVIAALADAVVVAECGTVSGSMSTARAAHDLGKVLLARPGSPGADALAAGGAALCEHAGDVFAALAGRPRFVQPDASALGDDARRTLVALDPVIAQTAEGLAAKCGLASRIVARSLSQLELAGLAIAVPGSRFIRSTTASPSGFLQPLGDRRSTQP